MFPYMYHPSSPLPTFLLLLLFLLLLVLISPPLPAKVIYLVLLQKAGRSVILYITTWILICTWIVQFWYVPEIYTTCCNSRTYQYCAILEYARFSLILQYFLFFSIIVTCQFLGKACYCENDEMSVSITCCFARNGSGKFQNCKILVVAELWL